jgi:hypothetical protein
VLNAIIKEEIDQIILKLMIGLGYKGPFAVLFKVIFMLYNLAIFRYFPC